MTDSIDFRIRGGQQLHGEVQVNTSKNGAMGLICASLLNRGQTTLRGIPEIEEVNRIIEVLESIGVKIDKPEPNVLQIQPPERFQLENLAAEPARKTRSIIMFMGPLIHRLEKFSLPHSQGCKLGTRTITPHLYGLEKLGVKIKVTDSEYHVDATKMWQRKQKITGQQWPQEGVEFVPMTEWEELSTSRSKKMKEQKVVMLEAGDTATENLLMAAAKIPGKTVIKFASSNYMVQDVAGFLQTLGITVEGVGTSTLTVYGQAEINQEATYSNSEDPIEAMMFLTAAIVTHSQLTVRRVPIDFLELELLHLEKMGLKYKTSPVYLSSNQLTKLVDLEVYPSRLKSLEDKITCGPYPNINIDNLPFFVPIACVAKGETLIHDWVYENRAIYFMELKRLGADMTLADPHRVFISGIDNFQPSQLVCPPALRPAMIILLAMLAAPGESILRNVYSIRRGYQQIAERLNELGADVEVIRG
jgi:UDP-N-acetylglucosamine 1-carboxyvinyltransferase